jgi:hypothetical protein
MPAASNAAQQPQVQRIEADGIVHIIFKPCTKRALASLSLAKITRNLRRLARNIQIRNT